MEQLDDRFELLPINDTFTLLKYTQIEHNLNIVLVFCIYFHRSIIPLGHTLTYTKKKIAIQVMWLNKHRRHVKVMAGVHHLKVKMVLVKKKFKFILHYKNEKLNKNKKKAGKVILAEFYAFLRVIASGRQSLWNVCV